eukprot:10226666-Lingulodinium_polyedra.AAC.1
MSEWRLARHGANLTGVLQRSQNIGVDANFAPAATEPNGRGICQRPVTDAHPLVVRQSTGTGVAC